METDYWIQRGTLQWTQQDQKDQPDKPAGSKEIVKQGQFFYRSETVRETCVNKHSTSK